MGSENLSRKDLQFTSAPCKKGHTMSKKQYTSMADALRDCINEDPTSFKKLGNLTGVTRQSLMKFARGEQGLQLTAADKVAAHYGVVIVTRAQRRRDR